MRSGLNTCFFLALLMLTVLMLAMVVAVVEEIGLVVMGVEVMGDRWVEEGTKAPTAIAEETISVHACVSFMILLLFFYY